MGESCSGKHCTAKLQRAIPTPTNLAPGKRGHELLTTSVRMPRHNRACTCARNCNCAKNTCPACPSKPRVAPQIIRTIWSRVCIAGQAHSGSTEPRGSRHRFWRFSISFFQTRGGVIAFTPSHPRPVDRSPHAQASKGPRGARRKRVTPDGIALHWEDRLNRQAVKEPSRMSARQTKADRPCNLNHRQFGA